MSRRIPVKPAQPNQSVEWGIACLLELTTAARPMTCVEMARSLGVDRTKASRLLGTLAHLGMAKRLPDLSYVSGSGIHVLSALSLRSSGLLSHALPHIERIRERWHMDAALGLLWRDQVCYLYHSGTRRGLADAIASHALYPAAKSSIGQVILAQHSDVEVLDRLDGSLTPDTGVALLALLADVRRRGYAWEENHHVAMAIGHPATAAVAFLGACTTSDREALIADIRAATQAIDREVGYKG